MYRVFRNGSIKWNWSKTLIRKNSADSTSNSTLKRWKTPIMGFLGCYGLGFFISGCTQMPLDPDRMTQEKQSKMTQLELEAYDKEIQAKGVLGNIMAQLPAGWRWTAGFKVVLESILNNPINGWFGMKLGMDYFTTSKEPEWQIALPPPLEHPYIQPKFTITLEALDILICPKFDPVSGWRFKVRRGAEYFMKKIGYPTTELCIYTEASPSDVQIPIMNFAKRLEKFEMQNAGILYQLFRNSCKYEDAYKKDLSILGRDLKNVIHIDIDDECVANKMQQRNVIKIRKPADFQTGDLDMTLFDLADFLEKVINDSTIEDVRDEIEKFTENGRMVTDVFREQQADEEFERMEMEERLKELTKNNSNMIISKPKRGRFL